MSDPQALLARLTHLLGSERVLTAESETQAYLTDWRGRYRGSALAVVRPGSVEEVSAVVQACAAAGVPIVPQGGNTGLCGGATPLADGRSILVSLSRLNRIRATDADNNTLVAEAGCTLAAVQQAAEGIGRLFPLSLAAEGSCEIGGNLSTNAGGVHVLRYGNMRELTLGLEVVLPDGRVWDGLRGLRKDNTGYDLKQLFIGAEGTLGIITAAVLKLYPQPRSRSVAWLAVRDPQAAVELLGRLRACAGERLSAFELVGRSALELVLQHIPNARLPLPAAPEWSVLVELSDPHADAGLDSLLTSFLESALESGLLLDATLAGSLAQRAELWALRENISEAQKIEGFSIKHDISVPVSRIPGFLAEAGRALRAAWPGVRIVAFGHLGDGNLHYNLSRPAAEDNDAFIARTSEVNRIVHDLVDAAGGSISAEHGIGQLKRGELQRYKSGVELDLMRSIKAAVDPRGLMNPGKIL
ncbi:FAD-binding oxidoreductase [Thauera sp. CAU 1555]|uniref:FAD-binding oxidoreductase n=1 Tax=Thauera sedimentorum TaxID=2767595 RepID=A0ABR9B9X6_9RHOO|nr:FAD-binding oxidoreductase [Thauera sedimentorum]MBC9072229.1 FAD-binding oxidoreductase [Thauera sedimentorum]MBD8503148.1 FAD-binding oxidoreductase [Thauera sedimentorum]